MRARLYCKPSQMSDWRAICKAFAKKYGYTLLFVNENSCGVELKDGSFKHISIEELAEILESEEV